MTYLVVKPRVNNKTNNKKLFLVRQQNMKLSTEKPTAFKYWQHLGRIYDERECCYFVKMATTKKINYLGTKLTRNVQRIHRKIAQVEK